jgi:hypothetical protein
MVITQIFGHAGRAADEQRDELAPPHVEHRAYSRLAPLVSLPHGQPAAEGPPSPWADLNCSESGALPSPAMRLHTKVQGLPGSGWAILRLAGGDNVVA